MRVAMAESSNSDAQGQKLPRCDFRRQDVMSRQGIHYLPTFRSNYTLKRYALAHLSCFPGRARHNAAETRIAAMNKELLHQGFMTGQLLVAMPQMRDARFTRTVIYLCAHTSDGAMGLILNRLVGALSFPDLLHPARHRHGAGCRTYPHPLRRAGGNRPRLRPAFGRLFGRRHLPVGIEIGLTATLDILRDIAAGCGRAARSWHLGYAGWGPGQLDAEMQANAWLNVPADEELIFDDDLNEKWERCIGKLGVNLTRLSGDIGHA